MLVSAVVLSLLAGARFPARTASMDGPCPTLCLPGLDTYHWWARCALCI